MKAFGLVDFDNPARMLEVPTPEPVAGEILVRVTGGSLNGVDVSIGSGHLKGMMAFRCPLVLGKDFAGTVESLGDGVTGFSVGDRVFGVVFAPSPMSSRSFAEYITIPAEPNVIRVPDGISLTDAGVLGLAGATALAGVDAINPVAGETVLVSGASGGVGHLAVQLAASRGATVLGTARPGKGTDLVRDVGATHVIDFTADVSPQVRAIAPDGVDAVLHFAGDGAELGALLGPGGRIASALIMSADQLPLANAEVFSLFANPDATSLERLAGDVSAGRLRPVIQESFTLDQVNDAFAAFVGETHGKLAIAIS